MFFADLNTPAIGDAFVVRNLLLKASQIAHVLEVQPHIGSKDVVDHEFAHGNVREDLRPVSP